MPQSDNTIEYGFTPSTLSSLYKATIELAAQYTPLDIKDKILFEYIVALKSDLENMLELKKTKYKLRFNGHTALCFCLAFGDESFICDSYADLIIRDVIKRIDQKSPEKLI